MGGEDSAGEAEDEMGDLDDIGDADDADDENIINEGEEL